MMQYRNAVCIKVGIASELADIPTLPGGAGALVSGLASGQTAVAAAEGTLWVLVESDAPASGTVVPTKDDPDRRWLKVSP